MTDRLFQLEQELLHLRQQSQQFGWSEAAVYEDNPNNNRLLALEQSLTSQYHNGDAGDRLDTPVMTMAMGLLFVVPSATQQSILNALKNGTLTATQINPILQQQNQPTLTGPIVVSPSNHPNAWNVAGTNNKTYYIQFTQSGNLEVHNSPPIPFNLDNLNWKPIQDIKKASGGVTGGVTILSDGIGKRFFMKGIYGTWRRMLLCEYFLSLNPKIRIPQSKKLTQQQFDNLITHSKTLGKEQELKYLSQLINFGKVEQSTFSEIAIMSDVGGHEIEDIFINDVRAVQVLDPRHAIGKMFLTNLGYILGCDVFVSNPDRLIKANKHDNWHLTLIPSNPQQAIQDILFSVLDNESSLLEKHPKLTADEYCELLTTADLTLAEKLLSKYNNAHGQTLEMVGVEVIAEPDLSKSIDLRTLVGRILRNIYYNVTHHLQISTQVQQNIPDFLNNGGLLNQAMILVIAGVGNARDNILTQMRQITPAFLSKQPLNHPILNLFAGISGDLPDIGFNLQALVLRHLYLEHRRHLSVEKAKEDILQRIK